MLNINTNFLVEWLPQESNLANGVLEDWNSSSRYESGEASLHRGQWNWSDKNPNYYGFIMNWFTIIVTFIWIKITKIFIIIKYI